MTPENSKVSPELFLCDHCEQEMNAGLQPKIDLAKKEIDRAMSTEDMLLERVEAIQAQLGAAREDELALREQTERLKAQNAAMREALQDVQVAFRCFNNRYGGDTFSEAAYRKTESALSADAGRDYVSREAARPLAQVLRSALIFMEDYLDGHNHSGVSRIVSDGRAALDTARQLGLLK